MVSSTLGSWTSTLLEAALERGVLLEVLAVLVERGGADAMKFPTGERGLQHVAASIAPSALPAPTSVWISSMKMIVLPSSLGEVLQHRLQALLELAAVLGAGEERGQVEHQQALVLERLGTSPLTMRCARPSTMAVLPTPGSPISTGLFLVRRCRIWMQRRISSSRPITGSSFPCLARSVRSSVYFARAPRCDSSACPLTDLPSSHFVDRLLQRLPGEPGVLQQGTDAALVRHRRQQEKLGGDVLVTALLRFLVGDVEELREVARDHDLAGRALHLRKLFNQLRCILLEKRGISARLGDEAGDAAVLLAEEREQQVLGLDVLLVAAEGQALGLGSASCSLVVNLSNRMALIQIVDPAWLFHYTCHADGGHAGHIQGENSRSVAQLPVRPHLMAMERKTQFNLGLSDFALLAMVLVQQWWQRVRPSRWCPTASSSRSSPRTRSPRSRSPTSTSPAS
jgi:hypothetical protein